MCAAAWAGVIPADAAAQGFYQGLVAVIRLLRALQ